MTKEEMQLLRDIMREEIGTALQPIGERLDSMDVHLDKVDARLDKVETEIRHTRVLVEKQEHNVQLIAEPYGDSAEKLDKSNDKAAQIDDVRARLRTLETVVMNHTAAIKELRKAE